jgi:hypothetical protein
MPLSAQSFSDDTATTNHDSGIFAAPSSESTQLSYVSAGDEVPILGRSEYGEWFYIRNAQGIEGFAYAPRFEWSGDYASLPVQLPSEDVSTPAPTPAQDALGENLKVDIWPAGGNCGEGQQYRNVYIEARGGDGTYTYYWEGEVIGGPTSDGILFKVDGTQTAVVGTWSVLSGDGMRAEDQFYVGAYDCGD